MATKLSNPFTTKPLKVTQTTHNNLGGQDFRAVRAVDCNSVPYSLNIYAEGSGVVKKAVNNSGKPSSYIHIQYDGMPSYIYREFVHCFPLPEIKAGVRIKRGQRVGKICGYHKDWYGKGKDHAPHLHWSFYDIGGKGRAPNPFDYLDRTTKVTAVHPEILATSWFKRGVFQWDQFKDSKLAQPPVKPPVDPCEEKINKIVNSYEKELNEAKVAMESFKKLSEDTLQGLEEATFKLNELSRDNAEFQEVIKTQAENISNLESVNLSLRKKVGLEKIENAFTWQQVVKYVRSEEMKGVRDGFSNLLRKIADFLKQLGE